MYIYTVIIAILDMHSNINRLMWGKYCTKMCKIVHFFYFTLPGASALTMLKKKRKAEPKH